MSPMTLGVLAERLENFMGATSKQHKDIKEDVNLKHGQNRASIHEIRNDIQDFHGDLVKKIETVQAIVNVNQVEIVTLKVKLAMYASIGGICAGIVTAVATNLIQKLIH